MAKSKQATQTLYTVQWPGLVLQLEVLNCYGFTDSWMWKSVNHYVLKHYVSCSTLRLFRPIRFMFLVVCVCMHTMHTPSQATRLYNLFGKTKQKIIVCGSVALFWVELLNLFNWVRFFPYLIDVVGFIGSKRYITTNHR